MPSKHRGNMALIALIGASISAHAAAGVTRGEANAVFEASGNGGWAINLHGGIVRGGPADFLEGTRVRISPLPPHDGRRYCVLDWHVISLALIETEGAGGPAEAFETLAGHDVRFAVDGEVLNTRRLAPRRYLGVGEAFFVQFGRVMAPEDIPIGEHALVTTISGGGDPPIELASTFHIDGPQSETCAAVADGPFDFREVP